MIYFTAALVEYFNKFGYSIAARIVEESERETERERKREKKKSSGKIMNSQQSLRIRNVYFPEIGSGEQSRTTTTSIEIHVQYAT